MIIVADAGMLSASNLEAIDEAELRFIVAFRITKALYDLADHFSRCARSPATSLSFALVAEPTIDPDTDKIITKTLGHQPARLRTIMQALVHYAA